MSCYVSPSPATPQCVRGFHLLPPVLVFSHSPHRHPFLYIPPSSRFIAIVKVRTEVRSSPELHSHLYIHSFMKHTNIYVTDTHQYTSPTHTHLLKIGCDTDGIRLYIFYISSSQSFQIDSTRFLVGELFRATFVEYQKKKNRMHVQ